MTGTEITEVLGNLGDFIGAIAVFGTIVYLAIQVRHSKEATEANTAALENQQRTSRAQSRQALLEAFSQTSLEIARDRELQRTFRRALTDWRNLDPAEKGAFELAMARFFMNIQNGILLREEGLLDDETLALVAHYLVYTASSPLGGGEWWEDTKLVPPTVRDYVDHRIQELGDSLVPIDQAMDYWMHPHEGPA